MAVPMTTKAGERLMAEEWDNFDVRPWGSIADHVDAIETEAREQERERIEAALVPELGAAMMNGHASKYLVDRILVIVHGGTDAADAA